MEMQIDEPTSVPHDIFTFEAANQLVKEALDTDVDEPEPLVKLLLTLFDNSKEARLQDAIYLLMKVAYNGSLVHSVDLDEYLDSIRSGQNPLETARAKWRQNQEEPDTSEA